MKNLFEEEIQNNDLVIYLKSVSCGGGSVKVATIAKIEDEHLITWSVSRDYYDNSLKIVFKKKSLKDVCVESIVKKVKTIEAKRFIKNQIKDQIPLHRDQAARLTKETLVGLKVK